MFEEDLKIAREMGVRSFPSMFFIDKSNNQEILKGTKPYAFFEMAVLKLEPATEKGEYAKNWESLFTKYSSLTAKEFSELSGTPRKESETQLNRLSDQGKLEKLNTKNGAIWTIKSSQK